MNKLKAVLLSLFLIVILIVPARAEKIAKLDSPWVGKGKDDKQGAASDEADDE